MKNVFYLCRLAILACAFTACNHKTPERPKTPEELKQELRQNELKIPASYVQSFSETLKPNRVMVKEAGIFSSAEYETHGYLLDGSVKNTASVATFKDIVIKVSYVSETNAVISATLYTAYKVLSPNGTAEYEFNVDPPAYMKSYNVRAVSATPVY